MKQRINLNYFRAAACFAVMMVHLGQQITLPDKLVEIFDFGSSGVIVFYVLSGYLTFQSYDKSKQQELKTSKWLLKHIGKVLPVYYAIIILYMIYYELILDKVPLDEMGIGWGRYFLCLNQIIPAKDAFWSNLGGTWTISVFLLFYICIPILYKIVKNYYQAIVLFIVTYLGARFLDGNTEWFSVLKSMYYVVIGMILFFASKEKKENSWTLLGLLMLLGMIALNSGGGLKIGILISVMIIQSIEFKGRNGIFDKIVNLISKYSYSIYLVHLLVVNVIADLKLNNNIIIIAIFFGATVILSWCMYRTIEEPASKCINRIVRN